MCVCVCVGGGGGGGEGGEEHKAPLFFYKTNIYRVLSSLVHLNNEPDVTMSYLCREVPA